mgnify:CR=1 FL=1
MTIQQHVNLQPYNTFGISAFAKNFVAVSSIAEAKELFASPIFNSQRSLFIGGGSNILLTDDFDGLVVKVDITGISVVDENDTHIRLCAGAGESWHGLVQYCVARNYGGIENLSLIPGTVGAAPIQNIGAYGVELKDVLSDVDAIEIATGREQKFSNAECAFGYRESIFKQTLKDKYFITAATFTLTKKNHRYNVRYGAIEQTLQALNLPVSVQAISNAVIDIRRRKLPDPAVIGNAGSFFKNPVIDKAKAANIQAQFTDVPLFTNEDGTIKIPAAWLIEQCGWKGKTLGNIGVHKQQALVLVNYGGGNGKDIWKLAMDIQRSVYDRFDILLQPEVNFIL